MLYSVWKFRMRPGEEQKDGPPIHGNTMLEIIWTAIPALIIFSLGLGRQVGRGSLAPEEDPLAEGIHEPV